MYIDIFNILWYNYFRKFEETQVFLTEQPQYHEMIRGILEDGPLSPRRLLERVMQDTSGANPNKALVQHALECFLGFSIPEGKEEGFVFLNGDLVRATTISYDILLKDSQSIWNDICDIPDIELPCQT